MIVVVYIIANVLITGLAAAHDRKNGADQHLTAKGTSNWLRVWLSMLGIAVAGGSAIGNVNFAELNGISSVWMAWGLAASYGIFAVFFMRLFRVMSSVYGHNTPSGALEVLFSKKNSQLNSAVMIVFYTICFALQPKAAASVICPLTGWDMNAVIWVSGLLFALVAMLGGMGGVMWLSMFNVILLTLGITITCVSSVELVGGMEALLAGVPEHYRDLAYPDAFTAIATFLAAAFGACIQTSTVAVSYTAKSDRAAYAGYALTVLTMIALGVIESLIGQASYVSDPLQSGTDAMMHVGMAISPAIAGIAGCAVLAAIMSSAPGVAMSASNHFTEDIYKGILRKNATDRQRILVSRLSCVVIGVLGILFSYTSDSIMTLGLAAMKIATPTGIMMLIAVKWDRVTSNAAFYSVLFGSVVAFVWYLAGNPFGVDAFWPSAGVTILLTVGITLASKEGVTEGHRRYEEARHRYNMR